MELTNMGEKIKTHTQENGEMALRDGARNIYYNNRIFI